MSPIAAPSDRRFRRTHVKPSRRRRRAWLPIVVPILRSAVAVLLVAYGGYRLTVVAAHARVLQIDRIAVRGNDRLSKGEVLNVLNGLQGDSLLWTDLEVWRQRLLASPWVRDAALRRSLPSTIDVVISERQPIGLGRLNGHIYLVDERGVVIDELGPRYADLDLPIIDGLSLSPGRGDGTTDEARAGLAARVIDALRLRSDVSRRLSQVDVGDVHNAAVILSGDPAVIHLGEDRFLERLQAYLELSDALRERMPDIDSVDLRFEDRIYVRPAPKAAKVAKADAPAAHRAASGARAGIRR